MVYTSPTCGPCHVLKPQLKRVLDELGGRAQGVEIDIEADSAIAEQAGITGTPTVAGSFTVTVQVTDSSTGTGPFTAQQQYTLQVVAPQIAFVLPALYAHRVMTDCACAGNAARTASCPQSGLSAVAWS